MKIKKPSVKGMGNISYLGRFQNDQFIQQGHNSNALKPMAGPMVGRESQMPSASMGSMSAPMRRGIRPMLRRRMGMV